MKNVEAACAVIINDNKYLCTQRGYGVRAGLWEFPGGHVEPGEEPSDAAIREIKEEMNADIKVIDFLTKVEHDYEDFHLSMSAYSCELTSNFELLEAKDAKWLTKEELDNVEWCEADRIIIDYIKKYR